MEVTVSERRFYIWRLEYWYVYKKNPTFYPPARIHLRGMWFWRATPKQLANFAEQAVLDRRRKLLEEFEAKEEKDG